MGRGGRRHTNAKIERYKRSLVREYNVMAAGCIADYEAFKKKRQYERTMKLLKERLEERRRSQPADAIAPSTADAVPLPLKEEVGAEPNGCGTALGAKEKRDKHDESV